MNIPKVISQVVDQDMCTGCGLCISQCSTKSIQMDWNANGFLVPESNGKCESCGDCIDVCPFNPFPKKEVETEDEIAELFLDSSQKDSKVGKFENFYVGYSKDYRETSSSGGLGTFLFNEILSNNHADALFVVQGSKGFYEYQLITKTSEILKSSKTKYYPVSLATVFDKINDIDGKVAIVGVACFIKAIRLAQHKNHELKTKISFLIGIICGGLKSKYFSDYLANKIGYESDAYQNPDYRIKDYQSTASDYSFGCQSKSDVNKYDTLKMRRVGDMWGTGLFKSNACDFCEDVTTELADISLGDAWFPPYSSDGKGTSILITRSKLADSLIKNGINNQKLSLENLTLASVIKSQQGSFNHRQTGLKYRMNTRRKKNLLVPPKRERNLVNPTTEFKIVQKQRMKVRRMSLEIWTQDKNAETFEKLMAAGLKKLKSKTSFYHYARIIRRKLKLNN